MLVPSAVICVVASACLLSACGGGSSSGVLPTAPSPAPGVQTWTLTGQIINSVTKQPVNGVRLLPFSVTTSTNGMFSVDGTGIRSATRVTVEKAGYITRETTIGASTQNPIIDLIDGAGSDFSIDFYRQLVRDGYEEPTNLQPIRRWTAAPQFYINLTVPSQVRLLDADLNAIDQTIRQAVPLFTGDRLHVLTVTRGTAPPSGEGWVVVEFTHDPNGEYCAKAIVGANPGRMWFNYNRCSCGSRRIPLEVVTHELGHVMGFYHTKSGVMQATGYGCGVRWPSVQEQLHAAIAYGRPPGNLDPDIDPLGTAFLIAPVPRIVTD